VVGTVDNILRPRLVGGDTQMSDLLILVSTLGGLAAFGAVGIILGPVLAGLFVTMWDVYGVTFHDLLGKIETADAAESR
jgi:predicted PurR-regulated permease PerM